MSIIGTIRNDSQIWQQLRQTGRMEATPRHDGLNALRRLQVPQIPGVFARAKKD